MKKRILSILLLCCMVLTLLPTAAFAAGEIDEQFTLAPGGTYYFDLSAMGIPGTVNDALPDKTMRYVPFTYAGTVAAYKLTSEMATTEEYAAQNKFAHSLFMADYAVAHTVSWNDLNTADLIFGKDCAAGGVEYMLRAPSVGSGSTGSGESKRGTPQSNEWDRILDKNDGYIKNWSGIYSWGQDTSSSSWTIRVNRGAISARFWTGSRPANSRQTLGFRPVLEILNPGTLGSDGLKAVTLDLGGGKLGNSFKDIQIIVKKGSEFTAPASDGLTRPDGNIGSYFKWLGSDGELYAPGESVPAVVTKLSAQFSLPEQFTLTPGSTYYFDLSGVGIPGTANGSLPDASLHYVPFTYAGTVDAYKLTSEMVTTEEYAEQNQYPHSLFVADFAVTHTVNWNALNDASLIFGKNYAAGGVDYMLRAPSAGSDSTGSGDSEHGTPQSNEWDRILDKNGGYIKNWVEMFSWGQDTASEDASFRAVRGYFSALYWISYATTDSAPNLGFSPVLEVLNPGTLGSDGLKVVTLDLGGGKLGSNSDHIQIIVKKGESFTAPASNGLTRPDGNTGSYFKWLGSDGKLYVPGGSVPANVNKLTAQFDYTEQFTLDPGGTYYFDLSGVNIPGTVNDALPDKTMHYVPFTYAGTVDAYKLTSEMVTTEEYAAQNKFAHSLFMADYAVAHTVSWNDLNTADLIFGKDCAAGGVEYMLRAPSVGSGGTGWADLERGTPQSNEWDKILDKYDGYIKNWSWMHSWGQDTDSIFASHRAFRGHSSARGWYDNAATDSDPDVGFRPVLEVLNPGTLGSDGLKAVTLDLGGGKLGNSSEDIQIIVKNGKSFTAPASEGLTRPDGNTGNYFKWRGSDGELYAPDDNVPADVTKLTAQFDEQFTLAPGGTYYFDLSAMGIPGTVNDALPDKTMRYIPFTYAGTVDAYKLTSAMAATDEYAETNKYAHSLFVADYTVTHTVSWDELNAGRLIFGRDYAAGGVDYILRAPSVGSGRIGSAESQRGTPPSNEWDRILDKNDGYIKNWFGMYSWGQDTLSTSASDRAARGYFPPGGWSSAPASHQDAVAGFRPVLEVLNPGSLGSDGLKAVTLDLGGGKLGDESSIQIIVETGSVFTAPASDGLTRPDGNTGNYFMWRDNDGQLYAPGDYVPADVTKLTAQFNLPEQFTLAPGGTYYFDLSAMGIPGTVNDALPDKTMGYVPFTYAGTVDSYKLTSEMATTEEDAEQNQYPHSLFVADYAVTHTISWDDLNTANLIFGKNYASGGVDYTLRAPSVGSNATGLGDSDPGEPQSNEWDTMLNKDSGYIQNWNEMYSWGQDTVSFDASRRAVRGYYSARYWYYTTATFSYPDVGFRPVLEVLNPGTMGSDRLKAVTLDLGGGKLGGSSEAIQIVVKNGESFAAPASEGLTRPDGNTGSYFEWLGSDGELYEPGDNVSADVSKLTAQFAPSSHSVTITTDTLPDGKVGETYSQTLTADGTAPITWSIENGGLPTGLSLNKDTGEISGTPTADGTAKFTVKAENSVGSDTKELSITITKAAPAEFTISVKTDGNGTASASLAKAAAGTEITLSATPNEGYHFKEWKVESPTGLVITNNKFTMPNNNVEVKAIFEEDTPPAPTEHTVTVTSGGNGTASASPDKAVAGAEITLSATPDKGYHLKEWQVESPTGLVITNNKFTMPDSDVEVKAIFEEDAPPAPTEHTVTVTSSGNGTASASPAKAVAGAEITLSATPDKGYHLKEWQVISGGVSIKDNKFTMPNNNVEIKAIFEKDAPPTPTEYTVTVTSGGNGTASASPAKAVAGAEITLSATPDKGYHLKEWQVESPTGLVITNNKFTMPDSDVEVKAIFEEDAPPAPTDPAKPSISVTGTYTYNGSEHTAAVNGYDPSTMNISGNTATDAGDYTVRVTSKTGKWADGSTDAVTAAWSIGKATREAPDGLIGVAPSTEGGSDGKITGVTDEMEYRMADERIYTACSGTEIENLSAGHYFVRYAENNNHFASSDAAITVGEGTPLADCTITFNGNGGSGSMDSVTVKAGTNYILPDCGFTAPADQEFKAWEISGAEYKVGDSYTVDRDTEIKALWENSVITPTTYTVTVGNDGNGTASASHAKAVVGTEIALTATPNKGYHFKEWQVISGGVTIKDDKFLMPNDNVEVKAIFEKDAPPAPTEFTITVTSGDNGTASASHAKAVVGTEIRLTATPNTGYHLKEWQVISGGVTIMDDKFLMPNDNVEVKAIFEKDAPPAPTEYTITVTSGDNGTASASHAKAVVGTEIRLTATPNTGYHLKEWQVISGGVTIKDDKFTMPSANVEVKAIFEKDTGGGGGGYNPPVTYYTLRFETGGGSDIPSVQGTYNTYIDLTKYVPTWRGHTFIGWYSERSLMNKVSGVYLTKDMTVYAGWRVDENPGTGANPFTDVSEKDWFYGDVMFVYENGLMLGTSKTLFSPYGTATRGMMATILWRMEGSPAPKGKNSFTDVEAGKWYADAITWTAENGIFAGYGKDKFGPDDPITREQLAAIFYRYADYKGYDLTVKGNLDKFKDADKITDYAKTAMQWAVGSSLVKGKSGNLLDPQGTATRAEIAAMLHRFIEKYELVQGKAPGGLMGWIDPKRLQIPKTGDSSVLGLWGISLCTSLAGCLALTTWQIRRRREEESLQIIEK